MPKVIHKIKIGSAVGLGIAGAIAFTAPAYAETVTKNYSLTANVNSESELSLSLTNTNGVLNLAPGYDENSPASSSVPTTVTVKARDGYQLFMTGDTALTDKNTNGAIPALVCANNASTCDLTNNSWGFSVGAENTNFRGFTNELYRVGDGSGDTTGNYTLNFGAKVDYKTNPGVYTNLISLIAVANPSTVYMQDMSPYYCTTDRATTVTDSRDGTTYNVQRLKDGNCWMLDNLALGSTETTYTLTSNDTNLPEGGEFTLPISISKINPGASWINAYINAAGNCTANASNSLCKDSDGNNNLGGAYTKTDSVPIPNDYDIGKNGSGKIGVYYNFCAASVGTYCYYADAPEVQNNAETGRKNAEYDICPKGWRIPTSGDAGEYQMLYEAYGGAAAEDTYNTAFITAFSTLFSGAYIDDSAVGQGVFGNFWSSTWYSQSDMLFLRVDMSGIHPSWSSNRTTGRSIRCLLVAE